MRVLAIDTALEACSAAVLDTDAGAVIASETLADGARSRRSADAADRARDGCAPRSNSPSSTASPSPPDPAVSPACGSASRRRAASRSPPPSPPSACPRFAGFAAPYIADDDSTPLVAAIDARHEHVYLQVFGSGGRTIVAPRVAPLREAVRAAMTGPARIVGSAAGLIAAAWPTSRAAADAGRAARRLRHRLDRAARRRRRRARRAAEAALPACARRPAAGRCCPPAAPMIATIVPSCAACSHAASPCCRTPERATPRAIAALHAASFHRGWSDGELEAMLLDRAVLAHRAMRGRQLAGFILSRMVVDEAEILSVAVSIGGRGKGLARKLLDLHLRRLAGLGVRTVFLEVGAGQRAGAAALSARRLSRSRPPRRLLPRRRRQDHGGAGAAPRSVLSRRSASDYEGSRQPGA